MHSTRCVSDLPFVFPEIVSRHVQVMESFQRQAAAISGLNSAKVRHGIKIVGSFLRTRSRPQDQPTPALPPCVLAMTGVPDISASATGKPKASLCWVGKSKAFAAVKTSALRFP